MYKYINNSLLLIITILLLTIVSSCCDDKDPIDDVVPEICSIEVPPKLALSNLDSITYLATINWEAPSSPVDFVLEHYLDGVLQQTINTTSNSANLLLAATGLNELQLISNCPSDTCSLAGPVLNILDVGLSISDCDLPENIQVEISNDTLYVSWDMVDPGEIVIVEYIVDGMIQSTTNLPSGDNGTFFIITPGPNQQIQITNDCGNGDTSPTVHFDIITIADVDEVICDPKELPSKPFYCNHYRRPFNSKLEYLTRHNCSISLQACY